MTEIIEILKIPVNIGNQIIDRGMVLLVFFFDG